ncbi:hypothetical protein J4H92_01395 [Leucobacter weissii]|uniref:Response regulatory domain-containing protein n=1 Tax=Leucobacter weissii TaxID=1983706 RepID=A0A939MH98_9MICO|nr:hypothetical protein [Leucobacter weissii]MBO1900601.1 hypothetical protein [Leucobacter weissii]
MGLKILPCPIRLFWSNRMQTYRTRHHVSDLQAGTIALFAEFAFFCPASPNGGDRTGVERVRDTHRAGRPDVVLMDINMPPGMSGVEATAQLVIRAVECRYISI